MVLKSNNPDDRASWPDLGDTLQRAVEQVRQTPPPPAATVDRALERARRIGRGRSRSWSVLRLPLVVSGAVAAVVLVTLSLWYGNYPAGGYLAAPDNTKDRANPNGLKVSPEEPGIDPSKSRSKSRPSSPRTFADRVNALREMSSGMPAIDRKGVESYLRDRARPDPTRAGPTLVGTRGNEPPPPPDR